MKIFFTTKGCILLATILIYAPVLTAGFVWDDFDNIVLNLALRSSEGLVSIWSQILAVPQYYPLTYSTFWLEYHLWGPHPAGYHVVNVILHGINAVLLGLALRDLSIRGAWLAAALFALHPLHVESVAWITERKTLLAAFFFLMAFRAYLGFADRKSVGAYLACLALFVCALLSKTVACTFPVVMLLVTMWRTGRRPGWRDIAPLAPMVILAILMGLVTRHVEREMGAWGSEWTLTAWDRMLFAGRALWFYIGKLLWPQALTVIYPRGSLETSNPMHGLFPLAFLILMAALWCRRATFGRSPISVVLIYTVMIFPALGFVDFYFMRYSFVADHFVYLADAALIAAFSAALWTSRLRPAAYLILAVLSALTWQQSRIYKNEETLWRDTLRKNPRAWPAHIHLGLADMNLGREDDARKHFLAALRIDPDNPEAHNNLGNLFAADGRLAEALGHYQRALRRDAFGAESHNNVGMILFRQGHDTEALACFVRALEINPSLAPAHHNLALWMVRQGRFDAAERYLSEALRIAPDYEEARANLETIRRARLASNRSPQSPRGIVPP